MSEHSVNPSQSLFAIQVKDVDDRFGIREFESCVAESYPYRGPRLLIFHQKSQKKVYFSTDLDGVYPFYFHVSPKGVLFASSLPELCRRADGLEFSRDWLEEYFSGRTDYSKHAVFKDVKLTLGRCLYELDYSKSPASLIVHERRPSVWKTSDADRLEADEVAGSIKEQLHKSLKAANDPEGKIALLFSGGSDSLLLAVSCKSLGIPVDHYSLIWPEWCPDFTDVYVDSLRWLGEPAVLRVFRSDLFIDFLINHRAHLPADNVWDNLFVNTYSLSKEMGPARYSLVLNGENGDEYLQHTPRFLAYYLDSIGYLKQKEVKSIQDLCDQLQTDKSFTKDQFLCGVRKIYSGAFERLGVDVSYVLRNLRANDCFAYFAKYDRDLDSLFYDAAGISTGISESHKYMVATGVRAYSPLRNLEYCRLIARLKPEDVVAQMTTNKIYELVAGIPIYPQKIAYRSNNVFTIKTRLPEQVVDACQRSLGFMQDLGISLFNYYSDVLRESIERDILPVPAIRLAYFGNWLNGYQNGFPNAGENGGAYFLSF